MTSQIEGAAAQRARWLDVIEYEIKMLRALNKLIGKGIRFEISPPVGQDDIEMIFNAIPESIVLHARNLCDFCMRRGQRGQKNDIKPKDLFDDYDSNAQYKDLRTLVINVETVYTKGACDVVLPDGNTKRHSPKWAFDKMLAHPTQDRGRSFVYQPFLDLVVPKIKLLADEIRRLEKEQGRDFPSLS